jgi:hypothetical protein
MVPMSAGDAVSLTTDELLTARELARLLEPYGNLPVKLVLALSFEDETDSYITLLRRQRTRIYVKSAAGSDFGDLEAAVRLVVDYEDNA